MIEREPVGAIDAVGWVVDGDTVALVYDLDADLTGRRRATRSARVTWITSFIAERFTVVDDLITEIEVVYEGSEAGGASPT